MVFSSSTFLFVYFPVVLVIYYLLHQRYRNTFLFLASLVFYAWGEPKFVLVLIISVFINYVAALLVDIKRVGGGKTCKIILGIDVVLNLLLLFVFKYLNFITGNLKYIFPEIVVTDIVLPIGISFFTFQAISYVTDVCRGRGKAQRNILNVGLYITFFPQLIAGPIVRYKSIASEILERNTTWDDFCIGTKRFLRGIIKKIIVSNNLALVADTAFSSTSGDLSVCMAWFGMLAYTLQIYYDFSGYSDMAIGLGRMFGFHFNENFDYPYISKSITEFWRRWHISLGSWFRDYVYIPLGGSKVETRWRHIRNLFIVWFLTGIWHGARWNFIFWGLMYFVLLLLEKYIIHPEKFSGIRWKKYAWQVVTMLCVGFGWVLFRVEGLHSAVSYVKLMFGLQNNLFVNAETLFYIREYACITLIAIIFSVPVLRYLEEYVCRRNKKWILEIVESIVYVILFLFAISYLVTGAHNPFIYFNF